MIKVINILTRNKVIIFPVDEEVAMETVVLGAFAIAAVLIGANCVMAWIEVGMSYRARRIPRTEGTGGFPCR